MKCVEITFKKNIKIAFKPCRNDPQISEEMSEKFAVKQAVRIGWNVSKLPLKTTRKWPSKPCRNDS